jgi:hypothetical protein
MRRLVFIHGMSQERKDPTKLKAEWEDALKAAWAKHNIKAPQYNLEMPFYGDELDRLQKALAGGNVTNRGGAATDKTEEALYKALQQRAKISDAALLEESGIEVVDRGFANWELTQALGRLLLKKSPWLGEVGLSTSFVKQVSAYISRPHIQKAIDEIVSPALTGDAVVVSHSLGTIVSYHLLTFNQNKAKVCHSWFAARS